MTILFLSRECAPGSLTFPPSLCEQKVEGKHILHSARKGEDRAGWEPASLTTSVMTVMNCRKPCKTAS